MAQQEEAKPSGKYLPVPREVELNIVHHLVEAASTSQGFPLSEYSKGRIVWAETSGLRGSCHHARQDVLEFLHVEMHTVRGKQSAWNRLELEPTWHALNGMKSIMQHPTLSASIEELEMVAFDFTLFRRNEQEILEALGPYPQFAQARRFLNSPEAMDRVALFNHFQGTQRSRHEHSCVIRHTFNANSFDSALEKFPDLHHLSLTRLHGPWRARPTYGDYAAFSDKLQLVIDPVVPFRLLPDPGVGFPPLHWQAFHNMLSSIGFSDRIDTLTLRGITTDLRLANEETIDLLRDLVRRVKKLNLHFSEDKLLFPHLSDATVQRISQEDVRTEQMLWEELLSNANNVQALVIGLDENDYEYAPVNRRHYGGYSKLMDYLFRTLTFPSLRDLQFRFMRVNQDDLWAFLRRHSPSVRLYTLDGSMPRRNARFVCYGAHNVR